MKNRNQNQKTLDILATAAGAYLEKSPNLKNYQEKIDHLLESACDLESRQEILNILHRSKYIELMENLKHLETILNQYE
ncbi:hypothetical protein DSCO28_35460 [Desulfosarcina ovata subsp. sediminis]|uniref:Uncharacterized protein n=1 Tax=Desulfosarcina ovata subsp. sediminis TaxID=885957 RepID=A0A5K7ZRY6_9BACT|nr:hypothetical protein [Desulfosarcina ovata]BBO82980.1 hypothetical protein DSCO28_35460 [Desulfosarcina ovata subsp. sediminis]